MTFSYSFRSCHCVLNVVVVYNVQVDFIGDFN